MVGLASSVDSGEGGTDPSSTGVAWQFDQPVEAVPQVLQAGFAQQLVCAQHLGFGQQRRRARSPVRQRGFAAQHVGAELQQVGAGAAAQQVGAGAGAQQVGAGAQQVGAGVQHFGAGLQQRTRTFGAQHFGAGAQQRIRRNN